MVSIFRSKAEQIQLQNPIFDALYCEEEHFDEDFDEGFGSAFQEENETHKKHFALLENDLVWEEDELLTLLSKEKENYFEPNNNIVSDGPLMVARKDAVKWMLRVVAHYDFSPKTAVLAINYYDRFIKTICFQRDKPWMSQLAAVACLSIAAKIEEVQVPLLLDLQVKDSKFMFEAKTIKRMELLVLSTSQWKMKLVTPLSFFDHIVRRFRLMTNLNWEVLNSCEQLLLSIITDSRLLRYLPSVIATATMLSVIKDFDPCEVMQYQNQVIDALKVSKEKVNECYKLIMEVIDDQGLDHYQQGLKRKLDSIPSSPNGVIDAYFSCDSSNDSWDVAISLTTSSSSSSKPLFKKSRVEKIS
ncbi:hypothetical protein M9H77_05735 [Catharanthus roseus]|uniref:Uncharacterized protein n=1 Tax=Catharanthus roseus TaxID=4058 RepID=A0ACC0CI26_CATRO|nr:hypothetical protein M9H77_05735 [Catharanthus roseus]